MPGLHLGFHCGMDLANMREEYTPQALHRRDFAAEPFSQFQQWFEAATKFPVIEPNAMSLATVDATGAAALRTVLLKSFDDAGFVFFTNYHSAKAQDIEHNPQVALLFPWIAMARQIIVRGRVEKISREASRAYYESRPRASQIGAWVSHQSSVIPNRDALEQKLHELEQTYAEGEIPLPPFWGGFCVVPQSVEFWQGGSGRLHDRLRYRRDSLDSRHWELDRLSP